MSKRVGYSKLLFLALDDLYNLKRNSVRTFEGQAYTLECRFAYYLLKLKIDFFSDNMKEDQKKKKKKKKSNEKKKKSMKPNPKTIFV